MFSFTVDAAELAATVAAAAKALPTRTTAIAALQALRIRVRKTDKQISFAATDMEVSVESQIGCKTIAKSGEASVAEGRGFLQAIKLLTGELTVTADKETVTVQAGKSKLTFPRAVEADLPKLPEVDGTPQEIPGDVFADLCNTITTHASRDDTRPVLTGVLVELEKGVKKQPGLIRLAATDSYRLAVAERPLDNAAAYTAILPRRALELVAKLKPKTVQLTADDLRAAFQVEPAKPGPAVTLTTRRIDGQYPNYRQLLPEACELEATVARGALLDALKPIRKIATALQPVELVFSDDTLRLEVSVADSAAVSQEIAAQVKTEPFRIGFNAQFLAECVASLEGPDVTFRLISPLRPAVLVAPGNTTTQALLMPIRLAGNDNVAPAPVAAPAKTKEKNVKKTETKPAAKKPAAKTVVTVADFGKGSDKRKDAARKAAETRRLKLAGQAAATPAKAKKTAAAKGGVASAKVEGVAASKPKKAAAAKVVAGDFGKGSERRHQAAIKAAETRRQRLAAAA